MNNPLFRPLGDFFRLVIKPISLFGLATLYYFCYFWWSTVRQIYLLLSHLSNSPTTQKYWQSEAAKVPFPHPDVYRDSLDIIASKGYHFEVHTITTEDKYLLKAWRLYKDPRELRSKYPIMLQHGLLDCSWSWFLNNNKVQTLPYILCERGYDVWVMNNRGNKYSLGHAEIPDCGSSKRYWDFSFDEIVKFDVDANVNYVKRVTGKEKVIYIGHSQGSSQIFAKLTMQPTFQENFQCFIALGPAIFVSNLRSGFIRLIIKLHLFDILYFIDHPSFFCFDGQTQKHIGALCYLCKSVFHTCFYSIVNLLCGYPERNKIDLDRFGVMISHEPGGASTRNVIHWLQFIRRKQFSMFDFDTTENMKRYGTPTPPNYDVNKLKQFTIPKYFFIGTKDVICDEIDVQKLVQLLDNKHLKVEHVKDYAHLDYVWATDAHDKIYGKILGIIAEHQI